MAPCTRMKTLALHLLKNTFSSLKHTYTTYYPIYLQNSPTVNPTAPTHRGVIYAQLKLIKNWNSLSKCSSINAGAACSSLFSPSSSPSPGSVRLWLASLSVHLYRRPVTWYHMVWNCQVVSLGSRRAEMLSPFAQTQTGVSSSWFTQTDFIKSLH